MQSELNISAKSDWSEVEIGDFLTQSRIPIRLAIQDQGFPSICSVWYAYEASSHSIICVTHKRSHLAKLVARSPRCGFEVASNEPPYRGVRGKAVIEMSSEGALVSLPKLIERYLGTTNAPLGQWLMSRIDDEVELRLSPTWLSSWDYGARMEPVI
jgi:hypothetical protein